MNKLEEMFIAQAVVSLTACQYLKPGEKQYSKCCKGSKFHIGEIVKCVGYCDTLFVIQSIKKPSTVFKYQICDCDGHVYTGLVASQLIKERRRK